MTYDIGILLLSHTDDITTICLFHTDELNWICFTRTKVLWSYVSMMHCVAFFYSSLLVNWLHSYGVHCLLLSLRAACTLSRTQRSSVQERDHREGSTSQHRDKTISLSPLSICDHAGVSEGIEHIKCLLGYILSSACTRLNNFSWLSFMHYMGLYVYSLPFSLVMMYFILLSTSIQKYESSAIV